MSYRIPFGIHALLLEACEFATIVYGGQQLPEQQYGQANENNGGDDAQDNAQHKDLGRAFLLLLGIDDQLTHLTVFERKLAIILVEEHAQLLVLVLVDLDRINANGRECGAVLGAIIAVLQLTRLIHLALDAVLQVVTTARACGALVAIFTRVAALVHCFAFADAALAGAVARADLTAAWWHARVLRCLAVAAVARPAGLAHTAIALAGAVIGARAQ